MWGEWLICCVRGECAWYLGLPPAPSLFNNTGSWLCDPGAVCRVLILSQHSITLSPFTFPGVTQ